MALNIALKFVDKRRQNNRYRSCFDSANQQIFVHLWGPIVLGPWNIWYNYDENYDKDNDDG